MVTETALNQQNRPSRIQRRGLYTQSGETAEEYSDDNLSQSAITPYTIFRPHN